MYLGAAYRFLVLLSTLRLIHSQNDDNKNVEWGQDDSRWESKLPNWWDEANFKPAVGPVEERSEYHWMAQGQSLLKQKLQQKLNYNRAKNVVIFIGDGMGLATLMATRSYLKDVNTELSFEKFQHVGLAKTYCINYQVPDSSCSATAILTGTKNNYGTIGVNGRVNLRECENQKNSDNVVYSIIKYAQDAGKATGVVTTTRITHATPAAAYAHTSSRYWESNEGAPKGCEDIAFQLVHGETGSRLDVAMGGGRRHFMPTTTGGYRTDNRDLIAEYENFNAMNKKEARVVHNKVCR